MPDSSDHIGHEQHRRYRRPTQKTGRGSIHRRDDHIPLASLQTDGRDGARRFQNRYGSILRAS